MHAFNIGTLMPRMGMMPFMYFRAAVAEVGSARDASRDCKCLDRDVSVVITPAPWSHLHPRGGELQPVQIACCGVLGPAACKEPPGSTHAAVHANVREPAL
jgi:hypothetical protein